MKKMNFNELRTAFLDFYEKENDHIRLKSYSLIPNNDKSLLLINAGMAPLKDYFTGAKKFPKNRATSSQKCIRTADIENVGKTHRHATFFEMLGNFSFGDYFKKEAITWAWRFLTEIIELDKDKLSVTVYENDDEAYDIWAKEVGLDPSKISRLGKDENFWELEEGPCGPCTEIMYDRGEEYTDPEDRYLEIWNLVFTQFNKKANGEYEPLEHKNIDTGMGLERLALIVEDAANIFELDSFRPLLTAIEDLSGHKYGTNEKYDESFRVVMDHTKAMTFLIYDGVIPSNEGRGYVLRRLMRRAIRHGKLLNIEGQFLEKLSKIVMEIYKTEYPELLEDKDRIFKIINREEKKFQETLDQGLDILNKMIADLDEDAKELNGEDAFKLYDTYGFPLDLTLEILEEKSLTVNKEDFEEAMNKQKESSRQHTSFKGGWEDDKLEISGYPKTEFVGYVQNDIKAEIIGIEAFDDNSLSESDKAIIILDKTPFYAESGGQIGDTGYLESDNGLIRVYNTKKTADDIFYHFVEVENGEFKKGDIVEAKIDVDRREDIKRNHSATHLLNKALKTVLGNHINQAGSLVTDERLRFDFTHYEAITKEQLSEIERIVNKSIYDNLPVNINEMSLKESQEIGAVGLFEDKYKDIVRVVDMGGYSTELCGGTHVNNSSEIMMFKILSESGIAAGVRRIEAITAFRVYDYMNHMIEKEDNISRLLKTPKDSLEDKISSILEEEKELNKTIESFKSSVENGLIDSLVEKAKDIDGVKTIIAKLNDLDGQSLKNMADKIQAKDDDYISLLASVVEDKIIYVCSVSKALVKKNIKAGDLVKFVAQYTGGNGGGRPDFAQAGGKDVDKLDEALLKLEDFIKEKINS
ncbi:alanine--tRNA ligase [uncultured Helcococcus sp.]|uniref:alanine--tRNA ligase n=1 Tax=uncultured Helcococcus sp. TaxID=1072508 RepID=UPI002625CB7B|nr:alanine--tRNA ligase [uncultured Helcococcus sp.]